MIETDAKQKLYNDIQNNIRYCQGKIYLINEKIKILNDQKEIFKSQKFYWECTDKLLTEALYK